MSGRAATLVLSLALALLLPVATLAQSVEQAFKVRGQSMSEATLDEMEAEWQRVKASS